MNTTSTSSAARVLRLAQLALLLSSLIPALATATPTNGTLVADAWVNPSASSQSNGAILRASTTKQTFLRFNVKGVTGGINNVRLLLFQTATKAGTTTIYAANNRRLDSDATDWDETNLLATRPYRAPVAIWSGTTPVDVNKYVEFDITDQYITGDGTYSFAIVTSSGGDVTYDSKDGGANIPQLVITHTEDPEDVTYRADDLVTQGQLHGARYQLAGDLTPANASSYYKKYGVIDVTKQPYGARNNGTGDQRLAIQRAVNDALLARAVVYFPAGTYQVSDTIELRQGLIAKNTGNAINPTTDIDDDSTTSYTAGSDVFMEKWNNAREFGSVLMGPVSPRATIRLGGTLAPGFNNTAMPKVPKAVLHLWSRGDNDDNPITENQLAIHYNQTVTNLDFDIAGPSRASAVAIMNSSAQGGMLADINITAGTGADRTYAGLYGSTGPGGGLYGITVNGGDYGLFVAKGPDGYAAIVASCTFLNQGAKAVSWTGSGALTIVGTKITQKGIEAIAPAGSGPWNGTLNLIDTTIDLATAGLAIDANRNVYMNRVFVKRGSPAIDIHDTVTPNSQLTNATDWIKIDEYAGGVNIIQAPGVPGLQSTQSWVPHYIDSGTGTTNLTRISRTNPFTGTVPDYRTAHAWPATPAFNDTTTVINVQDLPYSAKGNGVNDDTAAIQAAIDAAEAASPKKKVFLPKGDYRLSAPLVMKYKTVLFGIHKNHTTIQSLYRDLGTTDFENSAAPSPLVISASSSTSPCMLADLTLLQRMSDAGSYLLQWKAGGNSVVKNVTFLRRPMMSGHAATDDPAVRIETANGGGRFYNIWMVANSVAEPGNFRDIQVTGTNQPLAFYMLNIEYAHNQPMVEFVNAANVNIYGTKFEGNYQNLVFTDCENFRVFGLCGNSCPFPNDVASFVPADSPYAAYNTYNQSISITNSTNFLFSAQSYQQRPQPYEAETTDKGANVDVYAKVLGARTDPRKFNRIKEVKTGTGAYTRTTPGTKQFSLYKNGSPTPTIQ